MADKIEVYIKNENVVISQGIMRPVIDHYCTDGTMSKTESIVPEREKLALTVAEEFANEKGLSFEVCDVHTFKGKLKAKLRGVRTTPTIIIGENKIEGELAPELLKSKLESCLT